MQKADRGALQPFDASTYRVGIVVAQFNEGITSALLRSAKQEAVRFKIPAKNIVVARVAGSAEIPFVLKKMADSKKFDALVALGAIIRGETDHYDFVAQLVVNGITEVSLDDAGIPVGFGILTCENIAQAQARIALGGGALAAAVHSARAGRKF